MVSNSLLYLLISTGLTIPPERSITTDKPFDVTDAEKLTKWTGYDEKYEDVTRTSPEENLYKTSNHEDEFSTILLVTEDPYAEESTAWPGYGEKHVERKADKKKCPLGEHFTSFWKKCERTCTYSPNPILCLFPKTKGCVCDKGLVRNKDGNCVPPDQCQNVTDSCPPGEKWSDCITGCYTTCENVGTTVICPTPEGQPCQGGCVCEDPEAVRGPDEKCIKPSLCPSSNGTYDCPQNEHYERCGTACPRTCFDNRSCPSNCCVEGCFCNEGFLRGPGGNCIQLHECPPDSKYDEENNFQRIDDNRGCPYEYSCHVYCVTYGQRGGSCEENICKCVDW